ncbi:MAG: hypothetical protein K0R93_2183 [Anaerosolibacter sp.]|nr:hypothetical protein [Anaerosolibacter sp.]
MKNLMGIDTIGANSQYFCVKTSNLLVMISNCCQFCRSYEGKITAIEEQKEPLPLIRLKANLLIGVIDQGIGLKRRGDHI